MIENRFKNAKVVASGVSGEVYQRSQSERGKPDFVMSRSELCEFSSCPARWRAGYERPESKALANGSLIDVLALSPSKFATDYEVIPKTYPAPATHAKVKKGEIEAGSPLAWNANAGYCSDWLDARAGKQFVKADDLEEANRAVDTLAANPIAASILANSERQVLVTGKYHDARSGLTIPVKSLMDLVPLAASQFGNCIVDLKTTRTASYRFWCKDIFSRGYHVQAAMYLELWNAATGENRDTFRHIVQENVPPFHVELRELTPEYLQIGRSSMLSALDFYCACLAKDEWPGYYARTVVNGWQMVEPEIWMLSNDPTMFRAIEAQEPIEDPAWLRD